jgi:hypothetical protein
MDQMMTKKVFLCLAVFLAAFFSCKSNKAAAPEAAAGSSGNAAHSAAPAGPGKNDAASVITEKIPVKIIAEPKQIAAYNGAPRRVTAVAEPEVPLSFSYYPSAEIREQAAQNRPEQRRAALSGFKRVERAPIEPGTYYVTVYFPGDEQHLPASAEVDFTIVERPAKK